MNTKRIRGFSMVEILMVVSIMSILAAVAMPAYYTAKREALRINCVNNLSQLCKGAEMFRADNNGDLPETFANHNNYSWVLEYVTTHDLFRCPGSQYPMLTQEDPVTDIPSYVYVGEEGDFSAYAPPPGTEVIEVVEPPVEDPVEDDGPVGTYIPEDMTYVYVVDDPNKLKFEDATEGLGEDETEGQVDQFLITVSGHTGEVGVTTKASTTSVTSTLEEIGDTVTDSLGFKITLVGIDDTGEYTFSIEAIPDEADGQFHALSHVEFEFSEGSTVTHINGQEIDDEEGEITIQRLQLVIGEEEPEDPPAEDPVVDEPVDPIVAAYMAVSPYKETMCIYDASSEHHEGRVNVIFLEDGHYEVRYGDYNFWQFNEDDSLVLPTIE